jgi:hypothetical protein
MKQLMGMVDLWRRRRMPDRAQLACGFILAIMGVNLLSNAALKSLTNDELVHIPSAHRYLIDREFSLNPEHPPLAKLWSALPLSFVHLRYSSQLPERREQDFAAFTTTYSANFWQLNQHRWWQIAFWSRTQMVLLTLALGILIFIYARTFFSARAAVFAVAVFSLEPTMLAHGWIVHTDIPAAFAYLLFWFAAQKYWLRPTPVRAFWLGIVTAAAIATKFSLAVVAPIFLAVLVYGAVRAGRFEPSKLKRLGQVCLSAVAVFVLVNAAYLFQRSRLAQQDSIWISANAGSPPTLLLLNSLSKLVPTYYLFGICTVFVHNRQGHPSALLGSYGSSGWWFYFPVAFALKTSLPFLLLTVSGVVWAVWVTITKREKFLLPLLLAIALYLGMAIFSHINIGVRHIAPIFPFLFLLTGAFLDWVLKTRYVRAALILVVLLMGWTVFDAVVGYRNYLSFTNALTFGRPAWQLLSDSNVEWGEEIGDLGQYLRQQNERQITAAMAAGWMTPQLHGIQIVDYPPRDLRSSPTKYVAIGASYLNGSTVRGDLKDENGTPLSEEQRVNYFANYRTLNPERVFGNSIYLYRKPE